MIPDQQNYRYNRAVEDAQVFILGLSRLEWQQGDDMPDPAEVAEVIRNLEKGLFTQLEYVLRNLIEGPNNG